MFETVTFSLNAYADESIAPIRRVGIGRCDSKHTSYETYHLYETMHFVVTSTYRCRTPECRSAVVDGTCLFSRASPIFDREETVLDWAGSQDTRIYSVGRFDECDGGFSSSYLKSCGREETFRFLSSLGGDTPTAAPAFAFPSGDCR